MEGSRLQLLAYEFQISHMETVYFVDINGGHHCNLLEPNLSPEYCKILKSIYYETTNIEAN